jgi:hypothetical protein
MHSAKLTFIDDVTLKAEWTMFQDAKPTMTAVMELTRVGPTSS